MQMLNLPQLPLITSDLGLHCQSLVQGRPDVLHLLDSHLSGVANGKHSNSHSCFTGT